MYQTIEENKVHISKQAQAFEGRKTRQNTYKTVTLAGIPNFRLMSHIRI